MGEPQRSVCNTNAIASAAMPLADDPIGIRRDACNGIPNHRCPYCAVAEGHLTTLSRDSRLNQCDSLSGRHIDPGNGSVTLIQDPDGIPANSEKPRPWAYRYFADNFIGCRIDPHECVASVAGDPDGIICKDRIERSWGNANMRCNAIRCRVDAGQVAIFRRN